MATLTIQQTAEETGVSVHTLRYYEKIGLVTPIPRADNGHRRYTDDDVYAIVFLPRLRATGMPIADIKRYVDLVARGKSTLAERLALLEAHRDAVQQRLAEVGRHLGVIERKIVNYRKSHREQLTSVAAVAEV